MQCEPAVAFDGPSSSCHQLVHISYSDSERSQFYNCIAAAGTEPPHNVSQHHSLAYTYPADHLLQSMYDQSLATSHPSHSAHPSYEEWLAYQTLTPDLDTQGYEHYVSFDAAESYRSSAAMEDIHQQPIVIVTGRCLPNQPPSLLIVGAAAQAARNPERLLLFADYHKYSHADKAFVPASALAQETATPMSVRAVPSQHATPLS
jgi:hypothetical protein